MLCDPLKMSAEEREQLRFSAALGYDSSRTRRTGNRPQDFGIGDAVVVYSTRQLTFARVVELRPGDNSVGVSLEATGSDVAFWAPAERMARLSAMSVVVRVAAVWHAKAAVALGGVRPYAHPQGLVQALADRRYRRREARRSAQARRHLANTCEECARPRSTHPLRNGRRIGTRVGAALAFQPARGPSLLRRATPVRMVTRDVVSEHEFTPRWTDERSAEVDAELAAMRSGALAHQASA